jgi:hypothetical protein
MTISQNVEQIIEGKFINKIQEVVESMSSQDFVDEVVLEINPKFDLCNDDEYEEIKMIIGEIVMERIQKTLNVFRLMEKHS